MIDLIAFIAAALFAPFLLLMLGASLGSDRSHDDLMAWRARKASRKAARKAVLRRALGKA